MDKTVLTLAVDSTQVGTAAAAFERMTGAGNAAAAVGGKVTASANSQAKAVLANAAAASKGKVAFSDLAAAAATLSPRAFAQVTAALAATSAEANNAAASVKRLQTVSATSVAPSVRTPLASPSPLSIATGQRAPAINVAQLAGDAGRAQTAVERLTAAARNQRSALTQLAPTAAATAVSYRQLANTPITLAAPQGLSSAAAALANATTQANNARVAITALNATRPPAPVSQASGVLGAAGAKAQTQSNNALAQSARQAAFQQQQLAFQLNDFFVQVASGGSPLTALIQQGSQLSGTFGGIGNAARAVTALMTPTVSAFAAAAVAVGGLTAALMHAESASRSLNSVQAQLAGTGRKDLFSDESLRSFLVDLSELPGVTRDTATAIVSELSKVHSVGGALFKDLAAITVNYAKATGKEAPEAARELARAFAEPQRGVVQLEAALGKLGSTQMLEVARLSRLGDTAGAQRVLFQALAAEVKNIASNGMTPLERSVDKLGNSWDRAMRSFEASKGLRTINALLGKTVDAVSFLVNNADKMGGLGNMTLNAIPGRPGALINAVNNALGGDKKPSQREASGVIKQLPGTVKPTTSPVASAVDAEIKRSLEAAKSYQGQSAKIAELTDTRKRFNNALAQSISLYGKDSQQAKVLRGAIAGVNEQIASAGNKTSGTEGSQVLRAQLQNDLKDINDVFEKQRDAFQFQNAFVEASYRNGTVSLSALMDQRREVIEGAAQAQIDALDKERARLQQGLKQTKDPSERFQIQTRINDVDVERGQVETKKSQDLTLLNQEEVASYRALSEQITEYRANLLQLAGDEAGAAALRAQTLIANARLLQSQSGGQISDAEVEALAQRTAAMNKYGEIQRQVSLLSANGARAEEAFALAAERQGKTLIETERGVYEIRVKELVQLGALAAAARKLAKDSTDPRIKAFAADLALAYGKAAAAIDPALNRLREANSQLAAGLANTAGQAPNAFAREYVSRRLAAADDIKDQRDEYSRKIDLLEGYLATTQDKNDKARLRARIKEAEGKRDSVKGESRGSSVFKAINDAVLQPMAEQVFQTVNKLLITDPLQKYLEGQLKGLTEGDGMLAGIFKDALGIKADPKDAAMALQTAAIDANRAAMNALTQAAQSAAAALSAPIPTPGEPLPAGSPPALAADAQSDASDSFLALSRNATSAASDVSRLASAAGVGGNAMSRLPAIVNLFQSAAAAMTAANSGGSSGSGIFGAIAGLFGGADAGGMSYESAFASSGVYHSGGVVGSAPATRSVAQSVFAGAAKYHTGGIAGKAADALKPNEVAAILMGGPKGTREEVITADDPRHRDNLGMNALAKIMAESKHEGMRVRGARELGGPVSANGMYRVNEKGPELLQVAGKQYLMTGSQGGTVKPNEGGGNSERPVVINNNFAISGPTNHASQSQIAGYATRGVQRGIRNT